MEMVVVLPAPLPPSSAVIEPLSQGEVDAVDGGDVAIDLAQLPHLDGRRRGPIAAAASAFASDVVAWRTRPCRRWAIRRPAALGAALLSGIARTRKASISAAAHLRRARATPNEEYTRMAMTVERHRRKPSESRLRLQTAVRLRWFGVIGQLVDRLLRLPRARLPAAVRHLPRLHRAVGLAQRLPAHPLSRRARASAPRFATCLLAYDILQLVGAALSDGRHREPLHVPARGAGDGLGGDAAAAQHHRARRCSARPPRVLLVFYHLPLPWYRRRGLRSAAALQGRRCWPRCCPA